MTTHDEYRSDCFDLIQDFYIPCLEKATVYSRAVGFFSSSSMAAAAKGLTALIQAGGKMQLVASPCLSHEDAEAIAQGLRQREEVISKALLQELDGEFEQIVQDRETLEIERNLLEKELRRFVEFADLADNAGEARVKLLDIQTRYGLLDI